MDFLRFLSFSLCRLYPSRNPTRFNLLAYSCSQYLFGDGLGCLWTYYSHNLVYLCRTGVMSSLSSDFSYLTLICLLIRFEKLTVSKIINILPYKRTLSSYNFMNTLVSICIFLIYIFFPRNSINFTNALFNTFVHFS